MDISLTENEKKLLDYLLTKHWGYLEYEYEDREKAKQGQHLVQKLKNKFNEV